MSNDGFLDIAGDVLKSIDTSNGSVDAYIKKINDLCDVHAREISIVDYPANHKFDIVSGFSQMTSPKLDSRKDFDITDAESIDPFWPSCPAVDFILEHFRGNKIEAHRVLFREDFIIRNRFLRKVPAHLMVGVRLFIWEKDAITSPIWTIFKAALIQVPMIATMDYFIWRILF